MNSVADVDISIKVDFLSRPSSYPDQPSRVEIIETHMSWVFLTEDFVYKLKKPVRLDFLDFSTVQRRHVNCLAELRLNRRLAGDVYLEIVPLTSGCSGRLELGGKGDTLDWLVKMRRLPRHCMLDSVIAAGQVDPAQIRRVARLLTEFYRRAKPVLLTEGEYLGRYQRDIKATDTALSTPRYALPRRQIDAISEALLKFLARAQDVFHARVGGRRIIEAHGDLRPEHVCLTEPPVIIDCLEFSRRLRELDPADELAFLDMECEFAGAPFIGPILFETYQAMSGDEPPPMLVCFYKGYRAQMRAKLSIWHLEDCADRDRDKWVQRAEAYLLLAGRYSETLDRQQLDY